MKRINEAILTIFVVVVLTATGLFAVSFNVIMHNQPQILEVPYPVTADFVIYDEDTEREHQFGVTLFKSGAAVIKVSYEGRTQPIHCNWKITDKDGSHSKYIIESVDDDGMLYLSIYHNGEAILSDTVSGLSGIGIWY